MGLREQLWSVYRSYEVLLQDIFRFHWYYRSIMDPNLLISCIANHVSQLLKEHESAGLHFHNLSHTKIVVDAAFEIGPYAGLSNNEMITVVSSAWFHDINYIRTDNGHENVSAEIACKYLRTIRLNKAFLKRVVKCILATRIPQKPLKLIEKIICDADFYHFSKPDYNELASMLRLEWELRLAIRYTDDQWNMLNLEMLTNHHYFTAYGKTTLQARKQQNIDYLRHLVHQKD